MIRRGLHKAWLAVASLGGLALISGCDSGGVSDIVFGSLQLAFGIVDLAT